MTMPQGAAAAGAGGGGCGRVVASAAGGRRGSFALGECTGSCSSHADGGGGAGANGSNGTGGSVLLYASDADFSALGELSLHAHGIGGGTAYDDAAGRGGDGLGGSVTVEGRLGAAGSGDLRFGNLLLSAEGASAPSSEGMSRSEEHTSELQSLMRISYAVFCLKKKN